MRLLNRTLGTVLLALCGLLAGFLGYRMLHRSTLTVQAVPAAAQPAQLPGTPPQASGGSAQAAAAAPSVPETLPDVQIPDLTGQPHSLRNYLGHPLVVNFWATWCAPCRREMPLLQQFWKQHQSQGIQVLGVAVDSRAAVQQYLRTTPVGYPILADEDKGSDAVARFGIEPVLPFTVFADAKGHIVAVKLGELHGDEAEAIIGHVQQVTLGRETLADARREIAAQLHTLAMQRAKQQAAQP